MFVLRSVQVIKKYLEKYINGGGGPNKHWGRGKGLKKNKRGRDVYLALESTT